MTPATPEVFLDSSAVFAASSRRQDLLLASSANGTATYFARSGLIVYVGATQGFVLIYLGFLPVIPAFAQWH